MVIVFFMMQPLFKGMLTKVDNVCYMDVFSVRFMHIRLNVCGKQMALFGGDKVPIVTWGRYGFRVRY